MNPDPYHYVVYWSEEDQAYVGQCPDLFYGGVHGDDPQKVFNELREVAAEVLATHRRNGRPLPPPRDLAEALLPEKS